MGNTNRRSLLDLVDRAERGALLPGEAVILRDAVELLDDLATTLQKVMNGYGVEPNLGDYTPDTTQQLRVISDDDQGARP